MIKSLNIYIAILFVLFISIVISQTDTCECKLSNGDIHKLENIKRNLCIQKCNDLVNIVNNCNTKSTQYCSCRCDNKQVECKSSYSSSSSDSTGNSGVATSISSTDVSGTSTGNSGVAASASSTDASSTSTGNSGVATSASSTDASSTSTGNSGVATSASSTDSSSTSTGNSGVATSASSANLGEFAVVSGTAGSSGKFVDPSLFKSNICEGRICPCRATVLNVTATQVIYDQPINKHQ